MSANVGSETVGESREVSQVVFFAANGWNRTIEILERDIRAFTGSTSNSGRYRMEKPEKEDSDNSRKQGPQKEPNRANTFSTKYL